MTSVDTIRTLTSAIKVLTSTYADVADLCDVVYKPWAELETIIDCMHNNGGIPKRVLTNFNDSRLNPKKRYNCFFKVVGTHRDTEVVFNIGELQVDLEKWSAETGYTFLAVVLTDFLRCLISCGLISNISNSIDLLREWAESKPDVCLIFMHGSKYKGFSGNLAPSIFEENLQQILELLGQQ